MKNVFTIAAMCALTFSLTASYAAPATTSTTGDKTTASAAVKPAKADEKKAPHADVALPATFNCQHCGMTMTVKTKDDWKKSCEACACGSSNTECYTEKKK